MGNSHRRIRGGPHTIYTISDQNGETIRISDINDYATCHTLFACIHLCVPFGIQHMSLCFKYFLVYVFVLT